MKKNNIIRFISTVLVFSLALSFVGNTDILAKKKKGGSGKKASSGKNKSASKKKSKKKKMRTVRVDKTISFVVKTKKKVKWKVKNKKIAIVKKTVGKKNNKAVIMGVGTGKTLVVAKAGNKRFTYNIVVKKALPNFRSVSVDPYDRACIVVNLKKKELLNAADFTVTKKDYDYSGNYNKKLTVKTVTTSDLKSYRVYLDETVDGGDQVKVEHATSRADIQFKPPFGVRLDNDKNIELYYEVGDVVDLKLHKYLINPVGNVKLSVKDGVLPAGLVLDEGFSTIKGKIAGAGRSIVTFEAVDELGRKKDFLTAFNIADENNIVANCPVINVPLNNRFERDAAKYKAYNDTALDVDKVYWNSEGTPQGLSISPRGGSGRYIFTLTNSDNGDVRLSTDVFDDYTRTIKENKAAESTVLLLPYTLTEGEHVYTVNITDASNGTLAAVATVTVNAIKYFDAAGAVKSTNGSEVNGNVYFIPKTALYFGDSNLRDVYGDRYYTALSSARDEKNGSPMYSTELPKGEYVVKVDGDILYQMDGTFGISKGDVTRDIRIPERFYTVSGRVTYSNTDNRIKNRTIYFETDDRKYEDYSFCTDTDSEGAFSVSLPCNTYIAYFVDEYGKKRYFTKSFVVTNKDSNIGVLKAQVTRYNVSGILYNGTATDPSSNMPVKLLYTEVLFYAPDGTQIKTNTNGLGVYEVDLEGGKTYHVRAVFGKSERTMGDITVEGSKIENANFTYSAANELAPAANDISALIGNALAPSGTGFTVAAYAQNDPMVRFTPDATNLYMLKAANSGMDSIRMTVYDVDSKALRSVSGTKEAKTSLVLEAGQTYFVKVIPLLGKNHAKQASGNIDLLVSYESGSVSPVPSTSPSGQTVLFYGTSQTGDSLEADTQVRSGDRLSVNCPGLSKEYDDFRLDVEVYYEGDEELLPSYKTSKPGSESVYISGLRSGTISKIVVNVLVPGGANGDTYNIADDADFSTSVMIYRENETETEGKG